VIIVSIVAASVGLPLRLRGLEMPAEPSYQAEEDRARVAAAPIIMIARPPSQRPPTDNGGLIPSSRLQFPTRGYNLLRLSPEADTVDTTEGTFSV